MTYDFSASIKKKQMIMQNAKKVTKTGQSFKVSGLPLTVFDFKTPFSSIVTVSSPFSITLQKIPWVTKEYKEFF